MISVTAWLFLALNIFGVIVLALMLYGVVESLIRGSSRNGSALNLVKEWRKKQKGKTGV